MTWAHLFLFMSLITGRIEENIACAPEYFCDFPRAFKSLVIDLRLLVTASLISTCKSWCG